MSNSVIDALFPTRDANPANYMERGSTMNDEEAAYFAAYKKGIELQADDPENVRWMESQPTIIGKHNRQLYDDSEGDTSELKLRKSAFRKDGRGLSGISDEESAWWAEQEASARNERQAEAEAALWKHHGRKPTTEEEVEEATAIIEGYREEEKSKQSRFSLKQPDAEKRDEERQLRLGKEAHRAPPEPTVSVEVFEQERKARIAEEERVADLDRRFTEFSTRQQQPAAPQQPSSQDQVAAYVVARESEVRQQRPDYDTAIAHLNASVERDLIAKGVTDPAQRQAVKTNALLKLLAESHQRGLNVADVLYASAVETGYKAPTTLADLAKASDAEFKAFLKSKGVRA